MDSQTLKDIIKGLDEISNNLISIYPYITSIDGKVSEKSVKDATHDAITSMKYFSYLLTQDGGIE